MKKFKALNYTRLILTEKDAEIFFNGIIHPKEPNEALSKGIMIEKLKQIQSIKWDKMMSLKDKKGVICVLAHNELATDVLALERVISILKDGNKN